MILYFDKTEKRILEEAVPGKGILKWLYNSYAGKISLELLIKRKFLSALAGWYMDKKISARKIKKFINQYNLDMSAYQIPETGFETFNEFFYRKIKSSERPTGNGIISPADGKILGFQNINELNSFFVKGCEFSLESFLQNKQLAEKYKDGSMFIVRLAPTDYHRFHFPASGIVSQTDLIKGKYYSVSPLALKNSLEIFCQNIRTFSTLKTKHYGDVLISEVGATMVGSVVQTYKSHKQVEKGAEKGYFAFGGSTVVLIFEKGKIKINDEIIRCTKNGWETKINMGETIAT